MLLVLDPRPSSSLGRFLEEEVRPGDDPESRDTTNRKVLMTIDSDLSLESRR